MTDAAVPVLPMRTIGRTGVTVTELGLGTAPLGENLGLIEEDEARSLLQAAWDGGIRYFDHFALVRQGAG